jgi:hypothetical protein
MVNTKRGSLTSGFMFALPGFNAPALTPWRFTSRGCRDLRPRALGERRLLLPQAALARFDLDQDSLSSAFRLEMITNSDQTEAPAVARGPELTVPAENSDPAILMMQSAKNRNSGNPAADLNRTR